FLVRKGEALTGFARRQRRLEPVRADDTVDDDAHVGMRRCLNQTIAALPSPESRFPSPVDQPDQRRLPLRRLLGQQLLVGVPGDGDDAKALPLPGEHLERGAADRPRRAEYCDADAHITPNRRYRPAADGIAK